MNKIIYIIFALVLVSCSDREKDGPEEYPSRTVICYFASDNNLKNYAWDKVQYIRDGWTKGRGELIIFLDDSDNGARLLRMNGTSKAGNADIQTIKSYGQLDSADPEVFRMAINDASRAYPADSYGLILFSHASGWLPAGTLARPNSTRSIAVDDGEGEQHYLELSEFASALPNDLFDFIIFESCLMAGVEVAYELRNKTSYILASSAEIIDPGFRDIYRTSVMKLFDTGKPVKKNLTDFAQAYKSFLEGGGYFYNDYTLSLISTSQMDQLARLCSNIFENAAESDVMQLQHFDRYRLYYPAVPRYLDLEQYLVSLGGNKNEVATLLGNIIVWKGNSEEFLKNYNGFDIKTHSGMTIYHMHEAYPELNEQYAKTSWYGATR